MTLSLRIILLVSFVLNLSLSAQSKKSWKELVTIEDLHDSYPEIITELFNQLDLNQKGLEEVKSAYEKGNLIEGCTNLLDYYQENKNAIQYRREQPASNQTTHALADTILEDIFTIQKVRGKVPVGYDGHRDWYYKGPNQDAEWAWLSNRHPQIDSVLSAYFLTGNPKYVDYIDSFLRDFIIKSRPYPAKQEWGSIWRGLEVSFRAKVWTRVFYGLINNEHISPATYLLMLSSLPDHAHYNKNFHLGNNWLTMELSGLATIAANFPEFKNSDLWMNYAIETMSESLNGQVYPDGAQTELTSHYHRVALENFFELKKICDANGIHLPEFYSETLEKMYNYTAKSIRPDGFRLLNNDGDKGSDKAFILSGANLYHRPEWAYIASNGFEGEKPFTGPSYIFPWAGHLISRSGFDKNAHWSFFDVGPWGSSHQHNDKLHLSVAAFGRDLLVDAGRFAYTGELAEKYRPYALSSFGHNVIIIDGNGQEEYTAITDNPIKESQYKLTREYDYVTSSMDKFIDIEGSVKHTRVLLYVREGFWVVVDRIDTDRPRVLNALWHWHPDCMVEVNKSVLMSNNTQGNLGIIPLGDHNFKLELKKGIEEPRPQGWYSSEYNVYEPNAMGSYNTRIEKSTTLVWLLIPSENKLIFPESKIIDETENSVSIEVKSEKASYKINLPYYSSEGLCVHIK